MRLALGSLVIVAAFGVASCSSDGGSATRDGGVGQGDGSPREDAASGARAASGATPVCGTPCADPDGCYPCEEGSTSTVDGTPHECFGGCWTPQPTAGPACMRFGRRFAADEAVPDPLACNQCTCTLQPAAGEAAIGCTTKACACDEAALPWVHFNSRDAECDLLALDCPSNTEPVKSGCGCGCSQDPRCPTAFDCTPGSGCDEQLIRSACPYSTLVR